MPVFISDDGTIYFANGLDNKYLYSLKNTDVTRLDYSSPKEFNKYNRNLGNICSPQTIPITLLSKRESGRRQK